MSVRTDHPARGQRHRRDRHAPRLVLHSWLAPFVAVALVAQLSAIVLPGTRSLPAYLASCAVLAVAIALALVLRSLRVSSWVQLLAPGAYLIALALLFKSQGSVSTGLQSLVLLPIGWVALYHRGRESAVVVLAVACLLAITSWLAEVSTVVIVRGAALWGLTGGLIVLGTHSLRRWLGDTIDEREEALRQAEVLGDVARELNSVLEPQWVVQTGVRLAAEIVSPPGVRARRANYCVVSDGIVRVAAEFDAEGGYVGASWPLEEHPLLERAVRERVATSGDLDPATLGPTVRELAGRQGVRHGAWVPVIVGGELHGVLAVAGRNRPMLAQEVARCVAIVRIMELALTNALAHERFQREAHTDALTGRANRRGMEQLVHERRGRRPLAVLAIDVDGLKDTNDRFGHAAGDELLTLVADAIGSELRTGDVLARIGGDEFAAVIFGSEEAGGVYAAARILDAVRSAPHRHQPPRVSIGVAVVEPGGSFGGGLHRADGAMYEAKRAGGMRYSLARHAPVSADDPSAEPSLLHPS